MPYIQNQVTFPYNTPGGYPVTVKSNNIQPGTAQDNNICPEDAEEEIKETKPSHGNQELLARIEAKFHDYQRSLWELQRQNMPGLPTGMYPSISDGHLSPQEGEH